MDEHALMAISPVDGRYRSKIKDLEKYFSEYALIRYRLKVETEYFIALCELPLPALASFPSARFEELRRWVETFTPAEAAKVKAIEERTNHDVKSVEYYLKERFEEAGLGQYKEFIHFGLTSQDINNTAFPMMMRDAYNDLYVPAFTALLARLSDMADDWADIPMLAFTHGQAASPTRVGKEILVFVKRLEGQFAMLERIPWAAKFGGATGNLNAHRVAYPEINWLVFADHFVNDVLGLSRTKVTTQIEPYDHLAALMDNLKRINNIFLDLARDFWMYISMEYFRQEIKAGEVGSSTMPHKVNPIDFENAEGNLGLANAISEHLAAKLPVSRLQRDLTDSTVLRNVGLPLAYTLIAFSSLKKGLNKLILNEDKIREDLEDNWSVVAEAIQTILRREGYPEPYEKLKELTRTHKHITKESLHNFIDNLDVPDSVKEEMKQITPFNYTGF
jgi:adenylosuccinate lyase